MGLLLFAIILGIIGEICWFKFNRDSLKHFSKYDKEHSNITVASVDEIASKLNQNSSLGISNIVSEQNSVSFTCENNNCIITVENGTAYVNYDMSGCEVRVSLIGKLTKRFAFWKSAHKAILINTIMDALQNNTSADKSTYQTTKICAKAAVIAFVSFLIFLVIGFCSLLDGVSNEAVTDAQTMEFYDAVTYEEVIDSFLKDAEWSAFNAENDIAVVEVNGTSVDGEKVRIQFWGDAGMGLSYRSLTLEIFEVDGISLDPDLTMEYIYLHYYITE